MKKVLAMILSLAMVLSLVACGGSSDSSAPADDGAAEESTEVITLRASSSTAPTHPYNVGLEKFAELVAERTNGQIKIDIFPSAQLGDERQHRGPADGHSGHCCVLHRPSGQLC